MSIIGFTKEEMARIGKGIIMRHNDQSFYNFLNEVQQAENQIEKIDIKNSVMCWIDRLYISNQLATVYTYGEKTDPKIERLQTTDFNFVNGYGRNPLIRKLKSLRYNIISNSGHMFTDPGDFEKLNDSIESISDEIVREVLYK